MKAIIISVGDELLIGQTINTNAAWIGQQLTEQGIQVLAGWTIRDDEEIIIDNLRSALDICDIVLVTGGLGPTSDDLTVSAIAGFYQVNMTFNETVWQHIQELYVSRNRTVPESTRKMAYIPENAIIMMNTEGTAPGTLYYENGKMVASMPGVPYEMKKMMEVYVLPFIREHYPLPFIINRNLLTAGVGETVLAEALTHFEQNLPEHFKLAYLPNVGKVRLRISGSGTDYDQLKKESDDLTEQACQAIQEHMYGQENDTLEASIGQQLRAKGLSIGTAESCTGGYIGHLITSVPGSSDYFKGGIICYSNEIKMSALKVQASTLKQYGAVSEETVSEMLSGALEALETDIAIAVSGIAGPSGGSADKPVGTVYIGVGTKGRKVIRRLQLTNNRERNIQLSAVLTLVLLRKFLLR